jgi:hypothetical protein
MKPNELESEFRLDGPLGHLPQNRSRAGEAGAR